MLEVVVKSLGTDGSDDSVRSFHQQRHSRQTRSIFVKCPSHDPRFGQHPDLILEHTPGMTGSDDGVVIPPHAIAENEDDKRGNHCLQPVIS